MKLYFSLLGGAFKILKKRAYFIVIVFLLTEDCMQIRGLVMSHDGHKNMEYLCKVYKVDVLQELHMVIVVVMPPWQHTCYLPRMKNRESTILS